jgi:diguanylate cyclase (GGDEF)-like protein
VLREVSRLVQTMVRDSDTVARWGGEEFCILLPKENIEQAMLLARRLIKAVAQLHIPWGDKLIQLTISIGVASMLDPTKTMDDLLQRADLALYEAKRLGRNRAHMASPAD